MHYISNFLHIVEAITASFTFTDIFNCLRVSHFWHDYFTPVLYLDVVIFRKVIDHSIVCDSPLRIQLDPHASLVARNPGLLAVSIEEARFHSAEDLKALLKFVRFLDDYATITCFFLEIESDLNPNVCKALLKILERQLDLIKTDSVKCLELAHTIVSCGRWDNEMYSKPCETNALTVMEKGNGLLEVRFWDLSATTLLQRLLQVCQIRSTIDQGD
ncbi:hypothetical protein BGZ52_006473 [Haplosporangium bisporale]|nr:hypothetical protein BGZ52_006473 [Haplosporangium bisporale]